MFDGVDTQVHYVAAKAGVLGLSRSLARVVGKDGITVNLVAPGLTMTPAVARAMPPEMVQAQVKARAIQRDETGEDLVGTVFFLLRPTPTSCRGRPSISTAASTCCDPALQLQRNLLGERTTR
jgi:NAD(P)-dependent dehydrogenase (short-subunit alcohol dehydrogenase family)